MFLGMLRSWIVRGCVDRYASSPVHSTSESRDNDNDDVVMIDIIVVANVVVSSTIAVCMARVWLGYRIGYSD